MSATILTPGFLTTVQDQGRVGFRDIGVSAGGALDAQALRVANVLVANEPSAAGLEVTPGEFRTRFSAARLIAWCGGEFEVRIADALLPAGRAGLIRAGEELHIRGAASGCRAWVAMAGGIDLPRVLGSRSTELRAGFGGLEGRTLQRGDVLEFSSMSRAGLAVAGALETTRIASWFAPAEWTRTASTHPVLRVVTGSEWDLFEGKSRSAWWRDSFTVTAQADRMGVRLEGATLLYRSAELLSEPVTAGTIQVPPSGQPIILLPDCQTIGGYPKLAHVITVDFPIAAQLRPGDQVRFREVSLVDAHRWLRQREREFELFRVGLRLRTG